MVFTDECRICGGPDCSKRWFKSDDYSEITTIETEQSSVSVMIFAAIGYGLYTRFIEGFKIQRNRRKCKIFIWM